MVSQASLLPSVCIRTSLLVLLLSSYPALPPWGPCSLLDTEPPCLGHLPAATERIPGSSHFHLPRTSTPTEHIWRVYLAAVPLPGPCWDLGLTYVLERDKPVSNMFQKHARIYACPRPKKCLPASPGEHLRGCQEIAEKVGKNCCICCHFNGTLISQVTNIFSLIGTDIAVLRGCQKRAT